MMCTVDFLQSELFVLFQNWSMSSRRPMLSNAQSADIQPDDTAAELVFEPTARNYFCTEYVYFLSSYTRHMPRWQLTQSLTLYGHIKTTEQRPLYSNTVMYTGHWWVGCYIWYSEEGPGWTEAPPSFLLAVPTVTVHPSTASVHTSCGTIIASGL